MVKSRFTSVDVAAMVHSLHTELIGAKVANVYDIGGKLFLFKFNLRNVPTTADKGTVLLVECGTRFHLTEFNRSKTPIPSGWTMNLRKLIKNKTLEKIEQVGLDRVVILGFGSVNVILEMYSKGNIIVTDRDGKVLMLLRSHVFLETDSAVAKNEVYPLAAAASVQTAVLPNWRNDCEINKILATIDLSEKTVAKNKRGPLERLLSKILPFAHTQLISEGIVAAKAATDAHTLVDLAIEHCVAVLEAAKTSTGGAIIRKNGCLFEFLPIVGEYSSFSQAVDAFFSSLEQDSDADRLEAQRRGLAVRATNIRLDQDRRMAELEEEQGAIWEEANLLENELELATSALTIVNTLVAQRMSWPEIEQTVSEQNLLGHVIAKRIEKLDLATNRILLNLGPRSVWLNLGLNAAQNVAALHAQRKLQALKLERTRVQAKQAVAEAEQKMKQAILKFDDGVARNRHLAKVRRRFWWEKFHWFLTSEGFLVIAGRDAAQNEQIYKKYMRKGDAYVHADIHGAASVLVKNRETAENKISNIDHSTSASISNIPPLSLAEAGQFSLCLSSAWTSKIVTSAWWVWPEQVSKTAPTGEYLSTGSFMIRGRKNFLPPTRLELGVGILFFLSEDSAGTHPVERQPRTELDAQQHDYVEEGVHWDLVQTKVKETKKTVAPKIELAAIPKKPPTARTLRLKKKNRKKDSDEDDLIRQEILGHRLPPVAPVVVPVVETATVNRSCFKCCETDHLAAECPNQTPAEIVDEDENLGDVEFLDRLAANVAEEEELLHAVAVVGPYSAIANYSLKIKVVPGSTKRGKAAKLCTQLLAGMTTNPTQQQLIKLVPVEEFSECLVPDVKLAAPGVTKLQIDNKRTKKETLKKEAKKLAKD